MDDEEEDEEEGIKNHSGDKNKSPKSILGVKDENVLRQANNNKELFDSPKRAVTPQQQPQHRHITAPSLSSNNTARQLFNGNGKQQPTPPNKTSTIQTNTITSDIEVQETGQELFPVQKLKEQQQQRKNGDYSSNYSDASSYLIEVNNENKSPLLVETTPHSEKTRERVRLLKNLGVNHYTTSRNIQQQSINNECYTTPPSITTQQSQKQHHLITSASAGKNKHHQQVQKLQQPQQRSEKEHLQFVRNALRRPFGRENLPPSVIVSVMRPPYFFIPKSPTYYVQTVARHPHFDYYTDIHS